MPARTYQLNAPAAVAEDVDGEVIAINMATGVYYSMVGWSAWAWNELTAGAQVDSVQAHVADPGAVEQFVEFLVTERLVVPRADGLVEATPTAPPDLVFDGLAAERFDDMSDLILLDPVHDVNAAEGWPRRVAPATE